MKKFFQVSLLLFSICTVAQSKFIEVEVRDTITLQPSVIHYNLLIGDSYESEEWDENQAFDQKAYEKRIQKNKEKVEKILQLKKYTYKPYSGNITYPPLGRPNTVGFTIAFNNKQELKALQTLLSDLDFINDSIDVVEYKDEEKAEMLLLKKLIDKAKSKAVLIASYSDLKLGKIIEVREGKELDDLSINLHDIYVETVTKAFSEDKLTGCITRGVTVKFTAE